MTRQAWKRFPNKNQTKDYRRGQPQRPKTPVILLAEESSEPVSPKTQGFEKINRILKRTSAHLRHLLLTRIQRMADLKRQRKDPAERVSPAAKQFGVEKERASCPCWEATRDTLHIVSIPDSEDYLGPSQIQKLGRLVNE